MANPSLVPDVVELLERRVATVGAQPLLTCYDTRDGSRVEFSARTFANWVDKTCNLVGSLGLDEGDEVALPLLRTDPGHWVGLVWTMAAWQAGCPVRAVDRDDLDRAALAVVGPSQAHPVPGVETVVCSLHPLGAGLSAPVAGVTDYATVLGEPDVHWRNDLPVEPLTTPEAVHGRELFDVVPLAGRVLVRPLGSTTADLAAMLLGPLAGGGSVVIVRGDADAGQLARIGAEEQAQLG